MKPHILWYSDSPTVPSGFGNVARGIIERLTDRFRFTCCGINYDGMPHSMPIDIFPAMSKISRDLYGREIFLRYLDSRARSIQVVFMLQDSFILSSPLDGKPFIERVAEICRARNIPLVIYFPIDGLPKSPWLEPLRVADLAVTYTHWGKALCTRVLPGFEPQVIYHGVDTSVFHRLSDYERRSCRERMIGAPGQADQTFVIFYVGQNQRRKILDWVVMTFAEFRRYVPNSILAMHTQAQSAHGWTIGNLIESVGLGRGDVVLTCNEFVTEGEMNDLYNSADCLLLPSAEGWGMPVTEAMAAGTPTVVGNHTALSEIGADGRSILIDCPDDPNHITIMPNDNEVPRRRPCINSAVNQLCALHAGEIDVGQMADKALSLARHIDWDVQAERWAKVFGMMVDSSKAQPLSAMTGSEASGEKAEADDGQQVLDDKNDRSKEPQDV